MTTDILYIDDKIDIIWDNIRDFDKRISEAIEAPLLICKIGVLISSVETVISSALKIGKQYGINIIIVSDIRYKSSHSIIGKIKRDRPYRIMNPFLNRWYAY